MKVLLIGGTGTISGEISKLLLQQGHELWMVNRGKRNVPEGTHLIQADIHTPEGEETITKAISGVHFDSVADFIAYHVPDVERDHKLFAGKTAQYIFISSASVYHKPLGNYLVDEGTTLANPYWKYAQEKIRVERHLMKLYRETGFPVTIVRPSHTYNETKVPLCLQGTKGCWQVLKRMLDGKPVIIPGDGTSLWTMTDSRDFAPGFVGLMGNIHAIGEAVQITGDETLNWNQIYKSIAYALGVELKPYYVATQFLTDCAYYDLNGLWGDKVNSIVFNNAKLKSLVPGYHSEIRFDQGVRRSVAYILEHSELQVPDPEFDEWCDRVIAAQEEALKRVKEACQ
ncbi:MAG: NAD-dependent epimerase/dehydratase family protein [Firmicutes bacterium]|nr:NAD-dependent epimerase/dehydratase family protein [Bacillota bacterium]